MERVTGIGERHVDHRADRVGRRLSARDLAGCQVLADRDERERQRVLGEVPAAGRGPNPRGPGELRGVNGIRGNHGDAGLHGAASPLRASASSAAATAHPSRISLRHTVIRAQLVLGVTEHRVRAGPSDGAVGFQLPGDGGHADPAPIGQQGIEQIGRVRRTATPTGGSPNGAR